MYDRLRFVPLPGPVLQCSPPKVLFKRGFEGKYSKRKQTGGLFMERDEDNEGNVKRENVR